MHCETFTYDDSALPNEPFSLGEVLHIGLLVSIDEDEIKWGIGAQLGE